MGPYTLPDLPYDYSALEPHISGSIMELHYGKHHAAYVKNSNAVLDKLDEARKKDDFSRVAALERTLAFNLSGHILHSILWQNMMPKGGGVPTGDFANALQNDFGNFERFRKTAYRGRFNHYGFRLGRTGLGTNRKKAADHTNL